MVHSNQEKKKAYFAAWYAKNRDRVLENRREKNRNYYHENKEAITARRMAAKIANPELIKRAKVACAVWQKNNLGKARAYCKAYREKYPEKRRVRCNNYSARKKTALGKLSADIGPRLFILQKGKCSICRTSMPKSGYHMDHIIPLSRGGINEDKNIQLTCPKCNIKKKDKDPIQFMQEMGYLL